LIGLCQISSTNDYQLSLFNGDIGIIWDTNEKELVAYFMVNKKLVAYPVYNLPAIDTNYAMTIHKTQGSEFERVDIILPHSDTDFLNKQLLYTGVTRAQKSVRIFSSLYTFKQTLTNSADRISGIESRLSLAFENEDNGK
jgi:exodeoxyribonuclease V alpha subunit